MPEGETTEDGEDCNDPEEEDEIAGVTSNAGSRVL
jgi:hypothetical protein